MERKFQNLIAVSEDQLVEARGKVVSDLIAAFTDGGLIPVWSGRTLGSVTVAPTGGAVAQAQPHPQRKSMDKEGPWSPSEVYGRTSKQKIGTENMFRAAATLARLEGAKAYKLRDKSITVSIASVVMEEIQTGNAPQPGKGRNRAPVLELAIEAARAKNRGVVK